MAGSKVIDADGHIIERTDELRKYLKSPFNKRGGPLTASEPWDRGLQQTLPHDSSTFPSAPTPQEWLRLLDDHGIEQVFLYPTALGNVSRIREPEYAVALCQAYNDYVHDRYTKTSNRLRPVALLPFQDPESAVNELRRAVHELGCRGAVVRTTGLRLPLGHKFYDPIYREAENLGCALAVHGTNGGDELAAGAFETGSTSYFSARSRIDSRRSRPGSSSTTTMRAERPLRASVTELPPAGLVRVPFRSTVAPYQ